nr:MAG TPA: hypothetical protein [Caudoviricetes sp.]
MKVYVITSGEYSDYYINAVALTRENAEQICAMLNSPKRHYSDVATIEEYDTDEIQCGVNEDVGLCYEAKFNYKTLENIYWGEPFYSFARNEIKRGLLDHRYEILIVATFPKDMPQEKARKIMKDRVAKWKAEREGL